MPKNASTDASLSDALIDVVDDVRGAVHGALGTRTWQVAIITRRWSDGKRGVGTPTIEKLVLDPVPRVERVSRDRMGPAGREAAGTIVVSQVSLRYTEVELEPKVKPGMEVAYVLTDLHGQRMKPRYFVLSASPLARRDGHLDWYILLNETADVGLMDGVDAP